MIKNGDFFQTEEETKVWLEKNMNAQDFTSYKLVRNHNNQIIVNVEGVVNLSLVNSGMNSLNQIPVQFGVVDAFVCRAANLTSLKGCPQTVNGFFDCAHNKLTTLEYFPKIVQGSIDLSYNQINSLKGLPSEMKHYLNLSDNKLTSLEFCPKVVEDFSCNNNQITSLKYFPHVRGNATLINNKIEELNYEIIKAIKIDKSIAIPQDKKIDDLAAYELFEDNERYYNLPFSVLKIYYLAQNLAQKLESSNTNHQKPFKI